MDYIEQEENRKPASIVVKDMPLGGELLTSFPDCPNHCIDGYILDIYAHRKVLCKYCYEKRKTLVANNLQDKDTGKTVSELLNLPQTFSGLSYNKDLIFSDIKNLTKQSVDMVLDELQKLMSKIAVGDLPDRSLLINLGGKSYPVNFIYPYLMKAYKAGVTVCPMLTSTDIIRERQLYNSGEESKFMSYIEKQVCIIVLDAGVTNNDINAVKGLMQLRGYRQLPTIIFTEYWGDNIFYLISENADNQLDTYTLAKLISIEVIKKPVSQPNQSMGYQNRTGVPELTQAEFNKLVGKRY